MPTVKSGLNYNYFRDYNPNRGRYVQSDPIGLWGGVNTYAYVQNDPVNAIDPRGNAGVLVLGPALPEIGAFCFSSPVGWVSCGTAVAVAGACVVASIKNPWSGDSGKEVTVLGHDGEKKHNRSNSIKRTYACAVGSFIRRRDSLYMCRHSKGSFL